MRGRIEYLDAQSIKPVSDGSTFTSHSLPQDTSGILNATPGGVIVFSITFILLAGKSLRIQITFHAGATTLNHHQFKSSALPINHQIYRSIAASVAFKLPTTAKQINGVIA
jgi:hypothetical protein